jgi:hypothetical protein
MAHHVAAITPTLVCPRSPLHCSTRERYTGELGTPYL